jgi:hypothetical protein
LLPTATKQCGNANNKLDSPPHDNAPPYLQTSAVASTYPPVIALERAPEGAPPRCLHLPPPPPPPPLRSLHRPAAIHLQTSTPLLRRRPSSVHWASLLASRHRAVHCPRLRLRPMGPCRGSSGKRGLATIARLAGCTVPREGVPLARRRHSGTCPPPGGSKQRSKARPFDPSHSPRAALGRS